MTCASLFDRSVDGMLLVTAAGRIEQANGAATGILGALPDDVIGSEAERWFPDFGISAGRPRAAVETTMISVGGDRVPAEVSVFPADEDTAAGRAWVVFRDLSARKGLEGTIKAHAESLEKMVEVRTSELQDLRARYRSLYDRAPILDFELDSQHSVASANRKACVSLGVTIDRLVGLPLVDLVVPDRRQDLLEALNAMSDGGHMPFETRMRAADGSVIDVVLHPAKVEGSAGRAGLRILGLDVTARREAEQLVDQSLDLAEAQRARMERILRGIGEGVVVMDPDGQVRLMNSIAERFLDIDERFAFGRDLLSEQRDTEFVRGWKDFTNGDEDLAASELTLGKSSNPRVFAVTMSRIRTAEGRPAGCVAVLRDVTRERQLDKMKTDFVSNLTHELRTPLASIRGFTATVLRGESVEEGDRIRFLRIIEKEAERLQLLIEDLLALSRLEAGRETLNLRAADFYELMSDARDAFSALASEKDISLSIAGQEFNGSGVFDPEKLRRVLDNLIGNALKFTPKGGHVGVAFTRDGERLQCEVRDNGRGMEPEVLERIFDRFYTSNRSTGNPDGTGLGLHIVKRIVEMHGGEITAESTPNVGTAFRFYVNAIPRAPRKEAAAEEPEALDPLEDLPDDVDDASGIFSTRAIDALRRDA